MNLACTKIVFLDGIRVPVASLQRASWGLGGLIEFQLGLPAGYEPEAILPSTFVHVFHAEPGKRVFPRTSVEVDSSKVGLLPTDANYLATDHVAAHWSKTFAFGEDYDPRVAKTPDWLSSHGPTLAPEDAILASMGEEGLIYQGGGLIERVVSSGDARSGVSVVLQVRGFEVDMDLAQIIQLVRGRGTLTDRERRFFGQDTRREGKPKTLLSGRNRNSTADSLVRLLLQGGYTTGLRRVMAQYPALLNTMWLHRFAWTRLSQQIAMIEDDAGPQRLIGTKAFRRYLRDQIQRSYTLPLSATIDLVLGFIGYQRVSIPAPAFWPLVPAPKDKTQVTEEITERKVTVGGTVTIRWGRTIKYDPAGIPGGGEGSVTLEDGQWYYRSPAGSIQLLDTVSFGEGQTYGRLSEGATRIDFELPQVNAKGDLVLGGGAKLVISTKDAQFGLFLPGVNSFQQGQTYKVSGSMGLVAGSGYGAQFLPYTRLNFTVYVGYAEPRTVRRKKRIERQVPAARPSRYYGNPLTRLGTYAILPRLWWACPPACNVVLPEEVLRVDTSNTPLGHVTRTIARGSPGQGPSAKTSIDKFTAPNSEDLNEALEDAFDDPIDAVHLQKIEYLAGVRANVLEFGNLEKLATRRSWETYMRAWVVSSHWDTRLGVRSAQVTLRTAVGLVPGTTALIIRGTEAPSFSSLSDADQVDLARLRQLRRVRRRLVKARAGLLGHLRRVRQIRRWVQGLGRLSNVLYKERLADQVDPTTVNLRGLWARTGTTLTQVNVGATYDVVGALGEQQVRNFEAVGYSSETEDPLSGARAAQDLGSSVKEDLSDPAFQDSFRRLLGDAGPEIWPGSSGVIGRLPGTEELEDMEAGLTRRTGGMGACVAALGRDIQMIDAEIQRILDKLRGRHSGDESGRSLLGYVVRVDEQTDPASDTSRWILTLSHVRRVGEDLDWDGIPGDDVENTIIFGEDGYLDEKYHSDQIGERVYGPIFGTRSLVDLPEVKAAFLKLEETSGQEASIDDILARLTHPDICGKDHSRGAGADADTGAKPSHGFAVGAIIDHYFGLKASGAGDMQLRAWIEALRVRPWMTLPDAYRGFALGYVPDKEAATDFSPSAYEPWEADGRLYGFGLADALSLETRAEDDLERTKKHRNPPMGFWSSSLVPPALTRDLTATQLSEGRLPPPLQDLLGETLDYGDELDDSERALLCQRQARILRVLAELRHKTASRRG